MTSHSSVLQLFGIPSRSRAPTAEPYAIEKDTPPRTASPEPALSAAPSSVQAEYSINTIFDDDTQTTSSLSTPLPSGTENLTPLYTTRDCSPDELAGDHNRMHDIKAASQEQIKLGPRTNLKKSQLQNLGRNPNSLIQPDPNIIQFTSRQSKRLSARGDYQISTPPRPKKELNPNRKPFGKGAIQGPILEGSAFRRKVYLLSQKSYFLPLLPQNNYILNLQNDPALQDEKIVPYTELSEQPEGIKATLKGYQKEGLSFLLHMYRNGMSGILGDEMGLGKTLQTLSLFQSLYTQDLKEGTLHSPAKHRPFLVVCPLSVLNSWATEVSKWTPRLKAIRFHGPKAERTILKQAIGSLRCNCANMGSQENLDHCPPDIIITTYETLTAEHVWLKRTFNWRCVVLDEGHKIKNHQSQISKSLLGLQTECRIILTGTPLQNNLVEMWALLHWMFPEVFTAQTQEQFKDAFDLTRGSVSISFMDCSKKILELIMLRRMKDSPGVNLGLPPKEEIVLYLPLTPMQLFWYKELLTRAGDSLLEGIFKDSRGKEQANKQITQEQDALEEPEIAPGTAWDETEQILRKSLATMSAGVGARQRLLNLLMQLRKCCGHPYLLPLAQPNPYSIGEHIIRSSSKFIVLEKLLQEICVEKREKVLIFSGFTSVLNYVEDMLEYLNHKQMPVKALRIDGSTARARRNLNIRLFNDMALDYNVMLISTKAGGLGITLTAATSVVFLDEEWNPQLTRQAEARAHRIGQTKKVTVYKMSTQGTVEEQMLGRIRKKLYLSAKITENLPAFYGAHTKSQKSKSLEADDDMMQLNSNELMSLIRRGAKTLSQDEIDATELLSWDLPTILAKCREKDIDTTHEAPKETAEDEEKWLQTMEKVETAVFNGLKVSKQAEFKKTRGRPKKENKNDPKSAPEVVEIPDLDRASRRKGKNTTVLVNGYHIDKRSLACDGWEAVPTKAKNENDNQDLKRERRQFGWQSRCQTCHDKSHQDHTRGEILLEDSMIKCTFCPRSYHFGCLDSSFQKKYTKSILFSCPQHKCSGCSKATEQAGGMLFRCRWCPDAYCEDCLDFVGTTLVGDHIDEMTAHGYSAVAQLFWIECSGCVHRLAMSDGRFRATVECWKQDAHKLKTVALKEWEQEQLRLEAADAERRMKEKIAAHEHAHVHLLDDDDDDDDNDDEEDDHYADSHADSHAGLGSENLAPPEELLPSSAASERAPPLSPLKRARQSSPTVSGTHSPSTPKRARTSRSTS